MKPKSCARYNLSSVGITASCRLPVISIDSNSFRCNTMVTVNVVEVELTPMGELADVVVDKAIQPEPGMRLMDDDSETWEVTGALHNAKRVINEHHTKLWTLQCKPVTASKALHTGLFKLIH